MLHNGWQWPRGGAICRPGVGAVDWRNTMPISKEKHREGMEGMGSTQDAKEGAHDGFVFVEKLM